MVTSHHLKAMSPVPPATSSTFGGGEPASQPGDMPNIETNSSFHRRCIPAHHNQRRKLLCWASIMLRFGMNRAEASHVYVSMPV